MFQKIPHFWADKIFPSEAPKRADDHVIKIVLPQKHLLYFIVLFSFHDATMLTS